MKLSMKRVMPIFLIALFTVLFHLAPMAADAQEEPITHNVSVNVMLLPVFVTGPNGEPVHGLNREDFELYANGKKAQIAHFLRYDFQHDKKTTETVMVEGKPEKVKNPTRAIFLIIDTAFIKPVGLRRAKKIAIDIIRKASPEDMLIVIENHVAGGPRLISGPGEEPDDVIRKIRKLKLPSSSWEKGLFNTREWNPMADSDAYDPSFYSKTLTRLTQQKRNADTMAYKNQVLSFTAFLRRLKFALKTIDRPKVVFLISEGIAKGAFKNGAQQLQNGVLATEKRVSQRNERRDMRMFTVLYNIVKAINQGGSVLYTINPDTGNRDPEASGEMSLRFLANESGGQYIAGAKTPIIIEKVKAVTSAYYEIAFVPTPDMGQNMNIQLECKRPGVKINTFRTAEKNKPYYRMEPLEKKLFALNMVTGGSWSRMVGKVVRVKYEKKGDQIEVMIPQKMKNKPLDIFSIQLKPKSQKANIQFQTLTIDDRAQLPIINKENSNQFFVIIEPVFSYCIYNRILDR